MKNLKDLFLIQLVLLLLFCSPAAATTIALNDFYADPTVTVASDGLSAVLEEDDETLTGSVLLGNDQFYGTSGISTAGLLSISVNYNFIELDGNDDAFYAAIYDTNDYGNPIFEFFTDGSDMETIIWDFAGIDLSSISVLGIDFQLNSFEDEDGPFTSTLTISNLEISIAPVPEPNTFILLGMGLFGLAGLGRRKLHS